MTKPMPSADKDRIERVANMDLYQIKSKVKFLSEDDIKFYWEEFNEKRTNEIATNAIKQGLSFDLIEKLTGLSVEKIKELQEKL